MFEAHTSDSREWVVISDYTEVSEIKKKNV